MDERRWTNVFSTKRRKFLKEWPKECVCVWVAGLKGAAWHAFSHSVWKRLEKIYQNPRGAAVFEASGSLSNFFKRKRIWIWFGGVYQISGLCFVSIGQGG